MSKKHKHHKSYCCCDPSDPGDPSNYVDCRAFCAAQQNQQMFFWLLIYSLYINNTLNCNILSKHDKLEDYLICTHDKLLNNVINN